MIGLDTNILARYYIEDDQDAVSQRQSIAARKLIESGEALMVCKTVVLEFEWVMRGYYGFKRTDAIDVIRHMLAMPQLTVENRDLVEIALSHCDGGLEFADALHHACYRQCDSMASFDDRKFTRRAARMGLKPRVLIPT